MRGALEPSWLVSASDLYTSRSGALGGWGATRPLGPFTSSGSFWAIGQPLNQVKGLIPGMRPKDTRWQGPYG